MDRPPRSSSNGEPEAADRFRYVMEKTFPRARQDRYVVCLIEPPKREAAQSGKDHHVWQPPGARIDRPQPAKTQTMFGRRRAIRCRMSSPFFGRANRQTTQPGDPPAAPTGNKCPPSIQVQQGAKDRSVDAVENHRRRDAEMNCGEIASRGLTDERDRIDPREQRARSDPVR